MSLDDRLSFDDEPFDSGLPPEVEPEEEAEPKQTNKTFIIIAAAMGGLIIIGALALVAALVFWVPQQREQKSDEVTATMAVIETQIASEPTATLTPVLPTSTPTFRSVR